MELPQTFADLINLWPSAVELSRDVGVKEVTARAWKARGIPAEYWADIVSAAGRRDFQGITIELLADIASMQRKRSKSESDLCAGA